MQHGDMHVRGPEPQPNAHTSLRERYRWLIVDKWRPPINPTPLAHGHSVAFRYLTADCFSMSGLSSAQINTYKCFAGAADDQPTIVILEIHLYENISISPSRKYAIKSEKLDVCAVRVLCFIFVFKHFMSSSLRISFSSSFWHWLSQVDIYTCIYSFIGNWKKNPMFTGMEFVKS